MNAINIVEFVEPDSGLAFIVEPDGVRFCNELIHPADFGEYVVAILIQAISSEPTYVTVSNVDLDGKHTSQLLRAIDCHKYLSASGLPWNEAVKEFTHA